jgi:hypothetical protein
LKKRTKKLLCLWRGATHARSSEFRSRGGDADADGGIAKIQRHRHQYRQIAARPEAAERSRQRKPTGAGAKQQLAALDPTAAEEVGDLASARAPVIPAIMMAMPRRLPNWMLRRGNGLRCLHDARLNAQPC